MDARGPTHEDDQRTLVLAAYGGFWEIDRYPDSKVIRADCDHLAWCSPPGQQFLSRFEDAHTICDACIITPPAGEEVELHAVPGWRDHLAQHLSAEDLEKVQRLMRLHDISETS